MASYLVIDPGKRDELVEVPDDDVEVPRAGTDGDDVSLAESDLLRAHGHEEDVAIDFWSRNKGDFRFTYGSGGGYSLWTSTNEFTGWSPLQERIPDPVVALWQAYERSQLEKLDDLRVEILADDPASKARYAAAQAICKRMRSAAGQHAIFELIKQMPEVATDMIAWDADHDLLAGPTRIARLGAGNGTDGWKHVSVYGKRRDDLCLKVTQVDPPSYRDGKSAWNGSNLQELLSRTEWDEESVATVQMLVGYTLVGGNDAQIMCILHGLSGTGKTQLLNMFARLLGGYAHKYSESLLRGNSEDRPRPDIGRAIPMRMLHASEFSSQMVLHAAMLKRLVGGEELSFRWMASNEIINRYPQFTAWMATNEMPSIPEADPGLKRRVIVVPMNTEMPRDYIQRLFGKGGVMFSAREATAFYWWALNGYERYIDNRRALIISPVIDDYSVRMHREFKSLLNKVLIGCFVEKRGDPEHFTLSSEVRTIVYTYVAEQGISEREFSYQKFAEFLTEEGFPQVQKWLNGRNVKIRIGLRPK